MPAVPKEVKNFIDKLKHEGFFKLYDHNKGSLIYHHPTNKTLPLEVIHDLITSSSIPESFTNYIIASLDKISGFKFTPNGDKLERSGLLHQLNTYKVFTPSTTEKDCPLFIEFIARLLPESNENRLFTQWLAHTIQKPQERPSWAVMLTSEQGTGKGFLFHKIINPLLSGQAIQCSNYNQFLGSHSTALSNNLFVMLDDTKSKSDSLITELKSKISEPEILVNPKYLQPYKNKVYARILLASNEKRPIKLGEEDTRRWFVPAYIEHKISPQETQDFIKTLSEWLDTDPTALSKIYNYLKTYDLTGFNAGYVEKTETLDLMVEMSISTKEALVREWINENLVFKIQDLQSHFYDYPDLAKDYASRYCTVKSIDLDGKRSRWWIPNGWKIQQARDYYTICNTSCNGL